MSETLRTMDDRTWMRPLAALIALALLAAGLGMVAAVDEAGAKQRTKAGKGKRGKGQRPVRPARPVVRTYVAKTRQSREPGPFGDNSKPARAVLKVLFNARRVPARVTVLQFAGEAGCSATDPRSRASGNVPGNWRFPRPIPVTVKRFEGTAYRGFSARGGDGSVEGSFRPGFRSFRLLVEREFTLPGSAIGSDLDEVECSVYEQMDGNLVITPKRKGSRGGKTRGGKDRARRGDSRR